MTANSPAPDHNQSEKAIKNWLKSHVVVGALVGIKRTQGGLLQFERAKVLSIRPKNFNVGSQQPDGSYSDSGVTFDYSGTPWRESSDRSIEVRLVMPTDLVLAACDACAFGERFLP